MRKLNTKKYSNVFNVFSLLKMNKYIYFGSPKALYKMFNIALNTDFNSDIKVKELLEDLKKMEKESTWLKVECVFEVQNSMKETTIKIEKYSILDYQNSNLKVVFEHQIKKQRKEGDCYGK